MAASFLAFVLLYAVRVSLSVVLVAMTKPHKPNATVYNHNASNVSTHKQVRADRDVYRDVSRESLLALRNSYATVQCVYIHASFLYSHRRARVSQEKVFHLQIVQTQ
jgi:hypothetical protein